jgi:phospholipid N-methyltransferase
MERDQVMNEPVGRARRLAAAWWFLRRGIEDFDTTASFVPSSRYLVGAMLRPVRRDARCVVELGSGTGVLTRRLLERLGPNAHVHAIELDERMLTTSTREINDPRMRPVLGSACEIPKVIDAGCVGHVDAVVSSLGLSLMLPEDRDAVITSTHAVLKPGGVFTQFTYLHTRLMVYSPSRRTWFRFYARPYLEARFASVRSEVITRNMPPAVVYTCYGQRDGART